jgi:hypothetical protein
MRLAVTNPSTQTWHLVATAVLTGLGKERVVADGPEAGRGSAGYARAELRNR